MKSILLMVCAGIFLAACGGAGGGSSTGGGEATKLEVASGGKTATLDKVGVIDQSEMNFTAPGKPTVKTATLTLFFASFDLDSANLRSMRAPLTAAEQTRMEIQLTGEDGSGKDTPFKPGTYSPKAANVNGVRYANISSFADGTPTDSKFEVMSLGGGKAAGDVKITSVTADEVRGTIDLTEGDKTVKGTFVAKRPAKK